MIEKNTKLPAAAGRRENKERMRPILNKERQKEQIHIKHAYNSSNGPEKDSIKKTHQIRGNEEEMKLKVC